MTWSWWTGDIKPKWMIKRRLIAFFARFEKLHLDDLLLDVVKLRRLYCFFRKNFIRRSSKKQYVFSKLHSLSFRVSVYQSSLPIYVIKGQGVIERAHNQTGCESEKGFKEVDSMGSEITKPSSQSTTIIELLKWLYEHFLFVINKSPFSFLLIVVSRSLIDENTKRTNSFFMKSYARRNERKILQTRIKTVFFVYIDVTNIKLKIYSRVF